MHRALWLIVPIPFLTGCLVVPEGGAPAVQFDADLASQYNFRGIPNNARGVLQADMVVSLPTKRATGNLDAKVWGNLDLSDDVGDAWFPEGHAGEFSQVDFHLVYSDSVKGFDLAIGLVDYLLQNPDDFPFATERGETKEVFVQAARLVAWDLYPFLAVHYDYDEVEGFYLNGGISRAFPLREKWVLETTVALGYSDEDQSDWNYGVMESGLADLRATGAVSYQFDRHATLRASVNGSSILDDDIQDWFDQIGVDSDNFWASIGVTWAY